MKTTSILLFVLSTTLGFGQTLRSVSSCDMTLEIVSEDGTNALGVCFDEAKQRYYTAFAGNESYPMEAFDANGEFIFTTQLGFDARGLWYNSKKQALEGIAYEHKYTFTIPVSDIIMNSSMPIGTTTTIPNPGLGGQQVAASVDKKKMVFVENGTAYFFKKSGKKLNSVVLNLASAGESLNQISPIYTGITGKEIGLYNWETSSLEFYSAKDGSFSGAIELDYTSCEEEIDVPYSFRVSYANNKVWLYDTYSRSWLGFSIWN